MLAPRQRIGAGATLGLVLVAALLDGGCVGQVGGTGVPGGPVTGGGASGGSTGPASAGSTGSGPGGGKGGAAGGAGPTADPLAAGVKPATLLSAREYLNTVRDLLRDTTLTDDALPPGDEDLQATPSFAFKVPHKVATQDASLLQGAAEALAKNAVSHLASLLPCATPPAAGAAETTCLNTFMTTFMPRVYRRPLTATETAHVMALYATGRSTLALGFNDAIGLLLEAALQSPQFLYHWEIDPGSNLAPAGAVVKLGPYELANRLSVFPVGHDARRGPVRGGSRRPARRRRRGRDPGAAPARRRQGQRHLPQLRHRFPRPRHPRRHAQEHGGLRDVSVAGRTDGGRGAVLRHHSHEHHRPLRRPDGRHQLLRQPGAGELLRHQRSDRHGPEAGHAQSGAAGGHPHVGGVPRADRRHRRVEPAPSRKGDLHQVSVWRDAAAAQQRSQAGRRVDGRDHAPAHGDPRQESLRGRLPPASSSRSASRSRSTEGSASSAPSTTTPPWIPAAPSRSTGRPIPTATLPSWCSLLADSAGVKSCFATQWLRYAFGRAETTADQASLDAASGVLTSTGDVREMIVALTRSRTFLYRTTTAMEGVLK